MDMKQLRKMQEQFRKDGRALFKEVCASLFEANPKLESFGWQQYTPYFNDGDPCVFSVYADYPAINGYDYNHDKGELTGVTEEEAEELRKLVGSFLNEVPNDIMESMFGDHVSVTVHRDGSVDTEEYSHD